MAVSLVARRRYVHRLTAAAAACLPLNPARASAGPVDATQPLRILVGYEAAGTLDVIARTLALKLQSRSGRRVVVVNRTGAGGGLALRALRAAPADGTVMLLTPAGVLARQSTGSRQDDTTLSRKHPPGIDAELVVQVVEEVASSALVLVIGPSVSPTPGPPIPGQTLTPSALVELSQLVAWSHGQRRPPACGDEGAGTLGRRFASRLDKQSDLRLLSVGYRGEIAALRDAAAGEIAMAFGSEGAVRPFLHAGRLRAIALGGEARSRYLPGVPTFIESGQPKLAERERYLLALPAGTPESIVASMARATREVLRDGDVRDIWARLALSGPASR